MSKVKRYTAKQLEDMAREIFREAGASEPLGNALFQAAKIEAQLESVIKDLEVIASGYASQSSCRDRAVSALQKLNKGMK
jgi:F0F1-type ATP synthase delta subunit